jgi:zinc transport system permease protein
MIFLSIFFGFVGSLSGLIFSYIYDIPSGAAIIFALVLMYGVAKIYFVTRKAMAK